MVNLIIDIILSRIVIGSFVVNQMYQIVYDALIYVEAKRTNSCDVLIDKNPALNDFVWFLSRSVTNIFWIIPIIYVFSPKRSKQERVLKERKSINAVISGSESSVFDESLT